MMGAEGVWEIPVPSTRFCCEPKSCGENNYVMGQQTFPVKVQVVT